MNKIHVLILTSITALLSLPVLAVPGESGDGVTCYADIGGVTMSSACSTRGTTCNEDSTCSIGSAPGTVGPTVVEQSLESAEITTANNTSTVSDNNATVEAVSLEQKGISPRDAASGMASGKRTAADSDDSNSDTESAVNGVGDEDIRVKLVAKRGLATDPTDTTECECPADAAEVCKSEGDERGEACCVSCIPK